MRVVVKPLKHEHCYLIFHVFIVKPISTLRVNVTSIVTGITYKNVEVVKANSYVYCCLLPGTGLR